MKFKKYFRKKFNHQFAHSYKKHSFMATFPIAQLSYKFINNALSSFKTRSVS
ncbi:hypothetical protein X975_18293, partial [Stegodyphus mimosarum]